MAEPTIAVLDVDGTLIDSNYQHALAWYRALRSVGETFPVWRLHRLIGMGGDQLLTALGGEDLERRVGDEARELQGKEVDAVIEEMSPLPGARDLLVAIKERGHRLVLASSGQQRHVDVVPRQARRPRPGRRLDHQRRRGVLQARAGPAAGGAEEARRPGRRLERDDR